MKEMSNMSGLAMTRRRFMVAGGGTAVACLTVISSSAWATPAEMNAAISSLIGDTQPREGRIKLKAPPVAEDGNVVPLTVSVDSSMTAEDHVRKIHVLTEENPWPRACSFLLGPDNGRAEVSTRIRLIKGQTVVVLAEMNDGAVYRATAAVKVTVGGCGG
jgi:sulfur-oxidizing protein SoxY